MPYQAPRRLAPSDQLEHFQSRSREQSSWLIHHAHQAHASGTARTLVTCDIDSGQVVAYYAWCMGSIEPDKVQGRLKAGAGGYPQPVAILARLAVDLRHEGRGLGAGLLRDVMARFAEVSEEIGARALVIHAESVAAQQFYLHLIPGLEQSPTHPLHLIALAKDVRRALR